MHAQKEGKESTNLVGKGRGAVWFPPLATDSHTSGSFHAGSQEASSTEAPTLHRGEGAKDWTTPPWGGCYLKNTELALGCSP